MLRKDVKKILKANLGSTFSNSIVKHFEDLREGLAKGDNEKTVFKSGKFVEAILKGLHYHTSGKKLTRINVDGEITRLGNLAKSDWPSSTRLLIPRVCRSVYYIASDRGGRHDVTDFDPATMDAEFVTLSCSYIMSELVRVFSPGNISADEAQTTAEELLEKKLAIVFEIDDKKRILDTSLSFEEQTLCLLYSCHKSTAKDAEIINWTEYSNPSAFKRNILQKLHKERLLEYAGEKVTLSPKGKKAAEAILKK